MSSSRSDNSAVVSPNTQASSSVLKGRKILYVVNVDWFFLSHRARLASAARDMGARVFVAATPTGREDEIRQLGFTFLPVSFTRARISPFAEARTVLSLASRFRRLQPDLVHLISLKPVLYGSVTARLLGGPSAVVSALTGLGSVFAAGSGGASRFWPLVKPPLRFGLLWERNWTIFQNPDDQEQLISAGLVDSKRAVLIRGSGVDCDRFQFTPEQDGPPIVMFAGRLLTTKGINEFVKAARRMKWIRPEVRFVLVGEPDPGNTDTVSERDLKSWVDEGVVEWWGHREDMPQVLAASHVVVLPSYYREGVPKILIEAAAIGRAIVTTDNRGCREIVQDGVNGLLIPPKDAERLVEAVNTLLDDSSLRGRFARAGREMVSTQFSDEIVHERTLALYRKIFLLGKE